MANSPARSVIDVGSVIDKYVIEALIGRGGMGAVFQARHRTLTDKKVAIKVLHAEIHDADIQARFKREAQIATKINHPNIVEVHDFDVTPDGIPYLVLEYLEGQTLAQRIAHGPVPLDQMTTIVRQIGSALAAAHREGVVHRDLKPQNIFLVPMEVDGRVVEVAKVLDFGISKWRGSETVKTQESALLGTPQYMAPEQATGRHNEVDQRTDVFAFGAIVYEMLVGAPAFTGASIPEVVFKVVYEQPAPIPSHVPDHVAAAIRKAMSKPSDERFATVSDFVEALTGSALSTFRPSMVTKPPADIGFASGSKKVSSAEALGETVGSGDYGDKVGTPAPADAPVVRGSAPTVASVSDKAPAQRKPTLWIALGAVAVAGTAVAMYLVMRQPPQPPAPGPGSSEQHVANPPPAVPVDAPEVVAQVKPDAAAVVSLTENEKKVQDALDASRDLASKPPAPPTPPKPPVVPKKNPDKEIGKATPPPPEAGEDEPEENDDVKGNLVSARQAYARGDLDLTDRLANLVINNGGPRQRAQGARLKGLVACQRGDLEHANAALNQLARNPGMRREVVAACHARGLDGVR